jgi:hypothetical protein
MLNVDQDLSRLSVSLDQHVQSITVLNPSEQTSTGRKGRDGISLNTQVPLGCLLIGRK